jgi:hypothetical protein
VSIDWHDAAKGIAAVEEGQTVTAVDERWIEVEGLFQ